MSKLNDARKEINEIDKEMAELFVRRMRAAEKVAEYKKRHGLPIYDAEREQALVSRNAEFVSDLTLREFYFRFITDVMGVSKAYQSRLLDGMKVAYSGTLGAFAYIAAGKIFPSGKRIAYGNFKDAYDSVVSGECDCAVLPIENSYAGEVGQVIDMLFSGPLYINGVYDLPVVHDLAALPGADKKNIKTVISHPQALSQCAEYIREHRYEQVQFENTAKAAEYVASSGDMSKAAICSKECAEVFGLDILERQINQSRSNTTRFGVFTRAKCSLSDSYDGHDLRFILMFTVRNEAGSLGEAINIIGKHGFNMSTLRSRPMKELMWNYYFYVECEGVLEKESGNAMLEELSGCCDKLKLVGTYKSVSFE